MGTKATKASALVMALLLAPSPALATTYYVAPTGNDNGAGSMGQPFATIAKGQEAASAGDTVLLRGGTYTYTSGLTSCSSATGTINAIALSKSGTSGHPIQYQAFPGETPAFDFSGIKDSCRVTGFRITGSWIALEGLEVRGVPQNNGMNHESWGIWNSGSHNTFDRLDLHHNMGPGLFIQEGSGNLVVNCDSHDNYDPMSSTGAGTNADGFGCHIGAGGTGNVFRGCRSWSNSDDGYDLIQAQEAVTIENSWAWNNGFVPGTSTGAGDGNGFKGGGYGNPPTNVPSMPPQHVIEQCVAWGNKAAGFYANHEPAADRWINDTGYANHPDFNMLGLVGAAATNVGILRNDLAFGGTLVSNETGTDDASNSWTLPVTVSAADFQSVSTTGVDGPRQADGSLPCLGFLRLAAGSDLIDQGQDVGLAFDGAAPDLGAFESGVSCTSSGSSSGGSAANGSDAGGAASDDAGDAGPNGISSVDGGPGGSGGSAAGDHAGAPGGGASSSDGSTSKAATGCSCRSAGEGPRSPLGPWALAVGLALGVRRHRKRRSSSR